MAWAWVSGVPNATNEFSGGWNMSWHRRYDQFHAIDSGQTLLYIIILYYIILYYINIILYYIILYYIIYISLF